MGSLASKSFLPYILQPTRITNWQHIYKYNFAWFNIWQSNSYYPRLPPSIPNSSNIFSNPPSNKSNISERDWSKFDQENFILDYFSIDWNEMLKKAKQNVDYSTEIFLNKINELLDNFAPFKKISKYKLKFK